MTYNKLALATDRPYYERQPKEPDKAWGMFVIYRDMGLTRSVKEASYIYREKYGLKANDEVTNKNFRTYSTKWRWRERVEAWDNELDRISRARQIREIQKMNVRHINMAMAFQSIASNELQKYMNSSKGQKEILLTFNTVLNSFINSSKIERTARGEPESIIEERKEASVDEKREILKKFAVDDEVLNQLDALLQQDEHAAE